MKYLPAAGLAAISLLAFSHSASANYGNSVQSCKTAIAQQMNVSQDEVRMKVRNIKTRIRNRDLRIHVYSNAATAKRGDKVVVNCKVHNSGDIVALDFVNAKYPVAASGLPSETES